MLQASGRAVFIYGSTYDITLRMRQEQNSGERRIVESRAKFQAILRRVSVDFLTARSKEFALEMSPSVREVH
jgi:hypothetical protein